jgi:hypothetical protein
VTSRSTIGPIEFIGDKNDIALVEPAWKDSPENRNLIAIAV